MSTESLSTTDAHSNDGGPNTISSAFSGVAPWSSMSGGDNTWSEIDSNDEQRNRQNQRNAALSEMGLNSTNSQTGGESNIDAAFWNNDNNSRSRRLLEEDDEGGSVATAAASSVLFEIERGNHRQSMSDSSAGGQSGSSIPASGPPSAGINSPWTSGASVDGVWSYSGANTASPWGPPSGQTQSSNISRPISSKEWHPANYSSNFGTSRSYSLSDEQPYSRTLANQVGQTFVDPEEFNCPNNEPLSQTPMTFNNMLSAPSGLLWSESATTASDNAFNPIDATISINSASIWTSRDTDPVSIDSASFNNNSTCTTDNKSRIETGGNNANVASNENAGNTESQLQNLISAQFGTFWGRQSVDQTTRWPPPPNPTDAALSSAHVPIDRSRGDDSPIRASGDHISTSMGCESNVWASEPPNGTRVWEEFYEAQGLVRAGPPGTSGLRPIAQHQQAAAAAFAASQQQTSSSASTYMTQGGQMWGSMTGSQVTGGSGWNAGNTSTTGISSVDSSGLMSPGQIDSSHWSSMSNQSSSNSFANVNQASWPSGSSDQLSAVRRGSNMMPQHHAVPPITNVPPPSLPRIKSDMTMRVQQVKYLCSLGFPRAEAQNALILNNMDLDRALMELRDRYGSLSGPSLQNGPLSSVSNRMHEYSGSGGGLGSDLSGASGMNDSNEYHPGSRMTLPSNQSHGSGAPLHLQQQYIQQQLRFPFNNRMSSNVGGVTHPSASNHMDPHLPSTKINQNITLLLNKLRQVNADITHLQAVALNGTNTNQLQVAYRSLQVQQQQITQQIQVYRSQLKPLSSGYSGAMGTSHGGSEFGQTNMEQQMNSMSAQFADISLQQQSGSAYLSGSGAGNNGGNMPSFYNASSNVLSSTGLAPGVFDPSASGNNFISNWQR